MERREGLPQSEEIFLTEDRTLLSNKAAEYEARLTDPSPRHQRPYYQKILKYRLAIMKKLLETGRANHDEIRASLITDTENEENDVWDFDKQWKVMKDYVIAGGKNLEGGTGLRGNKKGLYEISPDLDEDDEEPGSGRLM